MFPSVERTRHHLGTVPAFHLFTHIYVYFLHIGLVILYWACGRVTTCLPPRAAITYIYTYLPGAGEIRKHVTGRPDLQDTQGQTRQRDQLWEEGACEAIALESSAGGTLGRGGKIIFL
jgi:hypothetical protein